MAEPMMDLYWRTPPIARTVATAAFVTSVGVHLGVIPYSWVAFAPYFVMRIPPQLWRLATSFLITGSGLSVLMDTYFLYMYLSQLEVSDSRFSRKEDLIWYLIFVCSVVLGINIYVTGAHSFTQALITAVCYTATQDQRGAKASFYFVQIPAQLVPYCMMLVTLLFPGGAFTAMVMLTGLVAAHLFDFLTRIYPQFGGGPNLLPTPPFLSRLINTPRVNERAYGTAFRPGPAAGSGARTTGSSSGGGVLPDSWRSRGPGHRLGD